MVEGVRKVQRGWADLGPEDRARRLAGLRRILGKRAKDLVASIRQETGKPEVEALMEVLVVVDLMRFYEKRAPAVLGPRSVDTGWMVWKRAYTARAPVGVVGIITPWNYPLVLAAEPLAAALFAGNGVVLKPSEFTPLTGLLLGRLCVEAGLPEGLVEVVTGGRAAGEALARSGVARIHLVGSPATGRQVMAAAAESLTPVTLELGGKDAAIVLEDADVERAARGVVFGAFFNAGQTCVSVERAFVVDGIYDSFVRRVTQLTADLRVGSSDDADVGPVSTPRQLSIVEEHVREALAGGARALVGGDRTDPASDLFHPTVLVDVTPEMRVFREETFGPVLPVLRVRDEEEAIRLANDSRHGLFASVWTGDRRRGERVGSRLLVGGVSVNDVLSHWAVPGLPVGGLGESGFGYSRGLEGLLEMTRIRSVLSQRVRMRQELWWYPYSRFRTRLVRALLHARSKGGPRGIWEGVRSLMGWDSQ